MLLPQLLLLLRSQMPLAELALKLVYFLLLQGQAGLCVTKSALSSCNPQDRLFFPLLVLRDQQALVLQLCLQGGVDLLGLL